MVSRKVIATAAAHSHHSRRSIRRKFARRVAVCASPILPTVFGLRSRNHHLLILIIYNLTVTLSPPEGEMRANLSLCFRKAYRINSAARDREHESREQLGAITLHAENLRGRLDGERCLERFWF